MQNDRRLIPGPLHTSLFSSEGNLRPFAAVSAEGLALLAKDVDAMKETHRRIDAGVPLSASVKLT